MNQRNIDRAAQRAAFRCLDRDPMSPFAEACLPPPDVFGHLADRGIRRADVEAICRHVREFWPKVQRIDCGIDLLGVPHFDLQLDPFEWNDIEAHRPITDWVYTHFPSMVGTSIHFFPVLESDRLRASVTVFDRTCQARHR
jgi:hypothetical protein